MLIDIFTALDSADDLSAKKRGEMKSALRTVGRVLGDKSLAKIPSNVSSLNRLLENASPAALGIGERRWRNVLSLLRAALALTEQIEPGRRRHRLLPEWAHLHSQLDRSKRWRLSRPIRHLSEEHITPEAVTVPHLVAFATKLMATMLEGDVHKTVRDAASAWMGASKTIPGWPQVRWSVPSRRRDWALPWDQLHQDFRADAEAYLTDLAAGDPSAEGNHRGASPATIRTRRHELKAFASALVLGGRAVESITSLADLVELRTFRRGLQLLLDRRKDKSKPSSHVAHTAQLLKNIARHRVCAPDSALREMSAIVRRLTPEQEGLSPKNDERLRQFDDPANVRSLLALPSLLMDAADSGKFRPHRSADLAELAVAIEIEIMCPMRIKNLVGLTLEHIGADARRLVGPNLHVPADLTKGRKPLDFAIPNSTRILLERYLRKYRPLHAKDGCNAIFPGRDGIGHKATHSLSSRIKEAIWRELGLVMNVHLFRHFCGLIFLRRNPGQYAVLALLLGHASERTTRRFYARFETEHAFRQYDQLIDDIRRGERPVL